jgi:hypothetical protein
MYVIGIIGVRDAGVRTVEDKVLSLANKIDPPVTEHNQRETGGEGPNRQRVPWMNLHFLG